MQHRIEAYLNRELTEVERLAFEAELERSPELCRETEAMRVLITALEQKKNRRLLLQAEQYNREKRRMGRLGITLLALTAIGIGGWYFFKKAPPTTLPLNSKPENPAVLMPSPDPGTAIPQPEKTEPSKGATPKKQLPIAEGPSIPNPDQPVYRSLPSAESLEAEYQALAGKYLPYFSPASYLNMGGLTTSWDQGDYEQYYKTLQFLEEKNALKTPLPGVQLARAACLLHLRRPAAASDLLYPILKEKEPMGTDAQWLMALSYVMMGKTESAKVVLAMIKGKYGAPAKELLKELGD